MFLEHFPSENHKQGWIEVICGSMFSGKTEELIRRLKRAEFAQQRILLFKPKTDNRYQGKTIKSHKGSMLEGEIIQHPREALAIWKDEHIVAFDEVQFFDEEIVSICRELAKKGARVICAGLDMDFKGNPFGPMPQLLATAEYVTKVHAICVNCGNLAYISHRKVASQEQVLVGAIQEYEPLCRTCYNKITH